MSYIEKYISVLGSGAHDGTSEDDAWTFAEYLVARAPGERGNLKDDGVHTTAVDIAPGVAGTSANPIWLRGYTSVIGDRGKATIEWSHNSAGTAVWIVDDYNVFSDLVFQPATSNTANRILFQDNKVGTVYGNVILDGSTCSAETIFISNGASLVAGCFVTGKVRFTGDASCYACRIVYDGSGIALECQQGNAHDNLIYNPGTQAGTAIRIFANPARPASISRNTIRNFTTGLEINGNAGGNTIEIWTANNIFSEIAGDAISYAGTAAMSLPVFTSNAFESVGSNYTASLDDAFILFDIDLTDDPFTDEANEDFILNNTAGGGAACQSVGFPTDVGNSGTQNSFQDVGALQKEPAGGGGVTNLINGGLI